MTDQPDATPAPTQEEKPAAKLTKKSHKIVRWIRRRRRLLTFIGALIVFGTFVINDGLREKLRDLADTIDKSKNRFVVQVELTEMLKSMESLEDNNQPKETVTSISQIAVAGMDQARSRLMDCYDRLNLTADFLRNVPHLDNLSARVVEMHGRMSELSRRIDVLRKRYEEQISTSSHVAAQDAGDPLALGIDISKIGDEALDLESSAFNEAQGKQEYYERRYGVWTWASYVLYGLGWGFGLVGRLVGVETGVGE